MAIAGVFDSGAALNCSILAGVEVNAQTPPKPSGALKPLPVLVRHSECAGIYRQSASLFSAVSRSTGNIREAC